MTEPQRRYLLSREYLGADIESPPDVDPTGDVVRLTAVPPGVVPVDSDWMDAEWTGSATPGINDEGEEVLVTPCRTTGMLTPAASGLHRVLAKVSDTPETPVIVVGLLNVFT